MALVIPSLPQVSGWAVQGIISTRPGRGTIRLLLTSEQRFHQQVGQPGSVVPHHAYAFPPGPDVDMALSILGAVQNRLRYRFG